MKTQTTSKKIKECFKNRIYVDNKRLLDYATSGASFYNAGVYGWNYDAYIYDNNTILLHGYRHIPHNFRDYQLEKKYNNLFDEQTKSLQFGDERKYEIARDLLDQYVSEILKGAR